jgi:hypothetical protein
VRFYILTPIDKKKGPTISAPNNLQAIFFYFFTLVTSMENTQDPQDKITKNPWYFDHMDTHFLSPFLKSKIVAYEY